jgi:excisionase family DNA binding protein
MIDNIRFNPQQYTSEPVTIQPKPDPPKVEPITVDVDGAAKMLGVSMRLIEDLVKKNEIPYKRLGGRKVFSIDALKKFVAGSNPEIKMSLIAEYNFVKTLIADCPSNSEATRKILESRLKNIQAEYLRLLER